MKNKCYINGEKDVVGLEEKVDIQFSTRIKWSFWEKLYFLFSNKGQHFYGNIKYTPSTSELDFDAKMELLVVKL